MKTRVSNHCSVTCIYLQKKSAQKIKVENMKYTEPTFRPPPEASTPLLQVTEGCSHNKCSFCTMYQGQRFAIEDMGQIDKDLQELKETYGSLTRLFLLNADAFVLNGRRLKEIATRIIEYFPEIETITMYASIRNIRHKTDGELQELRSLRINDLWVGIESGDDDVLRHLNKGYDLKTARTQLARLKDADIQHNGIYMLGTGGRGRGDEMAVAAAKLINESTPLLVGVTSLGVFEGSTLAKEVKENLFIPASEQEILGEEKKLIELIDVEGLEFFGDHPINTASISGVLPEDRVDMLETLEYVMAGAEKDFLENSAQRTHL